MATRFIAVRGRQQRLALRSSTTSNIPLVPVERFSISFDEDLAAEVREAARRSDTPISAWLADTARRRLVREGWDAFFTEWQDEHGPLSEDELRAAREDLGLPERRSGS